ncbi:MAG: hypothetical protein ACO3JL_21475 [Myxococcota bacterium]
MRPAFLSVIDELRFPHGNREHHEGNGVMAHGRERFIRRGPFPGEEPDLTVREGGWHYIALGLAVALTLLSVVVMVTWPFAILAWMLVAGLWLVHIGAKKLVRTRGGED